MTWALPPRYVIDGRYEIVNVLGQGTFGITYKARRADGGLVAIKEYFPQDAGIRETDGRVVLVDAAKREIFDWGFGQFEKERRVLERISHPNVVRLVDHVEGNATRYLVFEFIDGQTLQHRIRTQARMSPDDLREFIGPILDGIEEVHRAGWVHSDIRPDNLMVEDGTNRPVLIDFGLALRPGEGKLETMPAGGFNYMAKEQLSEDATKRGPWTDIFGLGGICYFALFGRPPQSSMLRMAEDGYEPAEILGAPLNDLALMRAVDKALALESTDRYQSVPAFRDAILGPKHEAVFQDKVEDQPTRAAAEERLLSRAPRTSVVTLARIAALRRSASDLCLFLAIALLAIGALAQLGGVDRFRTASSTKDTALAIALASGPTADTLKAVSTPEGGIMVYRGTRRLGLVSGHAAPIVSAEFIDNWSAILTLDSTGAVRVTDLGLLQARDALELRATFHSIERGLWIPYVAPIAQSVRDQGWRPAVNATPLALGFLGLAVALFAAPWLGRMSARLRAQINRARPKKAQ